MESSSSREFEPFHCANTFARIKERFELWRVYLVQIATDQINEVLFNTMKGCSRSQRKTQINQTGITTCCKPIYLHARRSTENKPFARSNSFTT